VGAGEPVTVFAHGLAGSIDETRPFGSGVVGAKVFVHFRGHGASASSDAPWTYDAVADELLAVVTAYGASRGLGVSLGAGALLRLCSRRPELFEKLVLVLPATVDRPRHDPAAVRLRVQSEHARAGDLVTLADLLVTDLPVQLREQADVRAWARRQARRLAVPTVARALRELPDLYPVDRPETLCAVAAPALVIGQEDDAAHPASVARELARLLPAAELKIFDGGGLMWLHRAELRRTVSSFLNAT